MRPVTRDDQAPPCPDLHRFGLHAAIIDLDGTMIDTADDFAAGLNGMLARLGAEPTRRATKWSATSARVRRT